MSFSCFGRRVRCMLLGLPTVGGPVLHQPMNNMNKRIAFVDDDSKICRYFREYAVYRGYERHCYYEAESALKAIVRNREVGGGVR